MEGAVETRVTLHAKFSDDLFGREIASGRIVLMHRMHGHAGRHGPGRLGEFGAKRLVPLVGDADPVHRAEHDRLLRARQHDPAAAERQVVEALDGVVGHGRPERRRGVDIEGGDADGGLSRLSESGQQQKNRGNRASQAVHGTWAQYTDSNPVRG